jgi:hypothetical protein
MAKEAQDQRRERVCLRCDALFLSEGPGHRRCSVCTKIQAAQPSPELEYRVNFKTIV